jgi:branched-chain amino acid transport system substrate-binding protein
LTALAGLHAAAALPLTGRYAEPGRQAAAGLAAWAEREGVRLVIDDDGSDEGRTARIVRDAAGRADLLFGPYGSGPGRAAAAALAGAPAVLWNHGAAAARPSAARMVDVLAPAERYWSGLADVLSGEGVEIDRVAIVHAPTGFGRATAAGARAALGRVGARPLAELAIGEAGAAAAGEQALRAGARAVVGCGRIEDDLALGRALAGRGVRLALVVLGVALAARELGPAVVGGIGPVQWLPGEGEPPPLPLPPGVDYPAAQAVACGLVAGEAVAAAGSTDPDTLWDAARALRTRTFLGPFAVDAEGGQVAHAPFLVRWVRAAGELRREVVWRA